MSDNWFEDFSINFGSLGEDNGPSADSGNHSPESGESEVEESTEHIAEPRGNAGDNESSAPVFSLSDNEIERIFGDITAAVKQDEEVLRSAVEVIEAEHIVAEAEKKHNEAIAAREKYDSEIADLEKKMRELKRQRSEVNDEVWSLRLDRNRKQQEADAKKASARQAAENIRKAYEMDLLSDEFEQRAQKCAWWSGINDKKVMPHQWDAMRFMATGKRVILGDEMGLGKTLSAIGTLDIAEAKRVLVISPSDITGNFKEEFDFWSDRGSINIKGEPKIVRKQMLQAMDMFESFVVVVNYEAWRKDHGLIEQLQSMHFDTVIADEAHTVKEVTTNAFRGLQEIITSNNFCPVCKKNIQPLNCKECGWAGGSWDWEADNWADAVWESKSVQRVFLMTGTAILNKPDDLFALLHLIDPVNFARKNDYLNAYAEFDAQRQMWVFQYGGVARLIRRLSGKFLSRNLSDAGIILPPQKPIVHSLDLDPEKYADQIEVIEQITKYAEIVLDNDRRMDITAIIAIITRQRQANVWAGGISLKEPKTIFDENGLPIPNPMAGEIIWSAKEVVQSSVKMDKAVELCKEYTAAGQRIVIFSQFSTALRELHDRLNMVANDNGDKMFSCVFDGATPQDERGEIRRNFDKKNNEPKKWDIVLANYKTGGTGLNLTAATHTIILDREWNPGKENQALARTHRIGQTETTFVHILEIPDTIDEWLNNLINNKAETISGFKEGTDTLREELLNLLKNRKKK